MWPCFVWQQFSGQISAAIRHSRIKSRFISWCRRNRLSGKRKTTKRSQNGMRLMLRFALNSPQCLTKALKYSKPFSLLFTTLSHLQHEQPIVRQCSSICYRPKCCRFGQGDGVDLQHTTLLLQLGGRSCWHDRQRVERGSRGLRVISGISTRGRRTRNAWSKSATAANGLRSCQGLFDIPCFERGESRNT